MLGFPGNQLASEHKGIDSHPTSLSDFSDSTSTFLIDPERVMVAMGKPVGGTGWLPLCIHPLATEEAKPMVAMAGRPGGMGTSMGLNHYKLVHFSEWFVVNQIMTTHNFSGSWPSAVST